MSVIEKMRLIWIELIYIESILSPPGELLHIGALHLLSSHWTMDDVVPAAPPACASGAADGVRDARRVRHRRAHVGRGQDHGHTRGGGGHENLLRMAPEARGRRRADALCLH